MKIIADSINIFGIRATTFLVEIPTCLLAQLRTHRLLKWSDTDFSINANSDRAIPVARKIQMIKDNPYRPIVTMAQAGMSGIEDVAPAVVNQVEKVRQEIQDFMLEKAEYLNKLGVHKQYINRFLMPFSFSEVVITGDQFAFNHFFNLRCNKDVEPNFRNIANKMKELYLNNEPKFLNENDYHIAYDNEIDNNIQGIDRLLVSASMCARISYDIDKNESLEKHKERALKCYKHGHFSVFEHQLRTIKQNEINDRLYYSNIRYYVTMRKDIELYNLNLEQ